MAWHVVLLIVWLLQGVTTEGGGGDLD